MANIPPPPPLLLKRRSETSSHKMDQKQFPEPFSVTGSDKNQIFEFFDVKYGAGSVSLKVIISHYLAVPRLHNVTASDLYKILGRLRGVQYAIQNYNKGIDASSTEFLQYWKPRTLNLLSGFGFYAGRADQHIQIPGLEELVGTLEAAFSEDIQRAQDTIERGFITFDALGELYRPGKAVQAPIAPGSTAAAHLVIDSYYQENRGLTGVQRTFHWIMEFVATMGTHFSVVTVAEQLNGWTGVHWRSLSELAYTPVLSGDLAEFEERGQKYVDFAVGGPKFLGYSRSSFFRHARPSHISRSQLAGNLSTQLHSAGRIMVDTEQGGLLGHHACQGTSESNLAMAKLMERYRQWRNTTSTKASKTEALLLWDEVPPSFVIYCWPALVGFSFDAKCWGRVMVEGLQPIKFNNSAFQQLVVAEERKQLVRALVQYGNESHLEDFIGSKKNGSIFLLHGPPGVGKTLTAEAVAEVLNRPLYYVTMGELGITAEDMELRLADILELCAKWNAVTVLDEADVFLEQRRTSDMVRNSMVCVMLRLLEYHPGILFLTTNRVQTLDPAFESRITLALRYESLKPEARAQIWNNLLRQVSIPVSSSVDTKTLSSHKLNGRQIKNAIRLACAITRDRNEDALSHNVLEEVIKIILDGREEMANDDSWKQLE